MTKTVVGLFETQEAAEVATNALIGLGYTNDQIGVALRGEIRAASASSNDPLLMDVGTDAGGVRKVLEQGATSGWNAEEYASQLNYSGVVVTVQAEEGQVGELEDVLKRYGALDLAARQPSQTIDPTEAAVQEADAVDKPAAGAIAQQLTQNSAGNTERNVPASVGNAPLASSATVAATKPTGIATLRPGDNDIGASAPADTTMHATASDMTTAHPVATRRQSSVRTYTAQSQSYHSVGDGYPTADLNENTEPLVTSPYNASVSAVTGTIPPAHECDLTVGEQFGGVMADPAEEAKAEAAGDSAWESA